jgi:hypothetical protein
MGEMCSRSCQEGRSSTRPARAVRAQRLADRADWVYRQPPRDLLKHLLWGISLYAYPFDQSESELLEDHPLSQIILALPPQSLPLDLRRQQHVIMSDSPPPPSSWSIGNMTNSAVQFLRLPVLASSGLAVVASGLLYFKQKYAHPSTSTRPTLVTNMPA